VNRGEVWWVDHPKAGRRPHLILTRGASIPLLDALICVPATRTVRGIPTEVTLGPEDGMPEACVLSFDNTTLVQKQWFVESICTLDAAAQTRVCRALALATGCAGR
jgi:mRNA interferase MazF